MSNVAVLKRCSSCKQEKELETSFWHNKYNRDGYDYKCKDCRKASTNATMLANSQRYYAQRNVHKLEAKKVIAALVAAGKLTRLPCFLCGATIAEGHHLSYDFPEKVIWLCRQHHKDTHREVK